MRAVQQVLPGEPTDGTGRVLVHYFVHDPAGPARTPGRLQPSPLGLLRLGGAVGRIACRPTLAEVTARLVGGVSRPLTHSDEVRAVTCPKCLESEDHRKAVALLSGTKAPQAEG